MKKSFGLIKHFSPIALLTLIIVLAISHAILLYTEIHSVDQHVHGYSQKVLSDFDSALTKMDYVHLREILGLVRDDRSENIVFESPLLTDRGIAPIKIGRIESNSIFDLTKSHQISFQGAKLGKLTYKINLLHLSRKLFLNSILLYIFLIFVFSSLIFFSNLSFIRTLYTLERLIRKTASKNFGDTEGNPEVLSQALPSFLARPMLSLTQTVKALVISEQQLAAETAKGQLALQVAHDIRSPLSAMNMVLPKLNGLDSDHKHLLQMAIKRVNAIANDLLGKGTRTEKTHILSTLNALAFEKRNESAVDIQNEYTDEAYSYWANVDPSLFKRVLSNLINNAIEALNDDGAVILSVKDAEPAFKIEIIDNGRGIPDKILRQLGVEGITHGKSGHGLGVIGAKRAISSWGGTLNFKSQLGERTTVSIQLPKTSPDSWFGTEINLSDIDRLVIMDNNLSVHERWRTRLRTFEFQSETIYLRSIKDFMVWISTHKNNVSRTSFLIDFDLDNDEISLGTITATGLTNNFYLITNQYDDPELQNVCRQSGAKIIPKPMIEYVPIKRSSS